MGSSKELDPRLHAELQTWPEEDRSKFERFLDSSSLVRTVFDIEVGRIKPKEALGKIYADEEFVQLWLPKEEESLSSEKEKQYFDRSKEAYAKYLAFGAPFSRIDARLVAALNPFREYISYTRAQSEVGPAFLKVLDLLPYTDEGGLKFFLDNREVIAALDQQYFAPFTQKGLDKKDAEQTAKKAEKISDQLLEDALFLPLSDAKWRDFVRKNFSKLFVYTSTIWFPVEVIKDSIVSYYAFRRLFEQISDEENASKALALRFAMKLIFSGRNGDIFPELLAKIDEGVNNEDLRIIGDVCKFVISMETFVSPAQTRLLDAFWKGKITHDELKSLVDKLTALEHKIDELQKEGDQPHAQALEAFSKSEIFFDFDPSFILDHNIFPTDSIVAFLKERGQEGIKELIKLKEKTKRGEFDPRNPLQKDLEYILYLALSNQRDGSYESFSKTQFVEDGEEASSLDSRDVMEARVAAFEAARVYWIIRERTDIRKKVFVVGNNRYGKLFVIDPLRQELELLSDLELIDSIGSKYVKSHTGRDVRRGSQIFSDNNLRNIASQTPDIIVVDGTEKNLVEVDGKKLPRFSSAMMGYYNWVKDFNEGKFGPKPRKPYGITYRSFINSGKAVLGDEVVDQQELSDSPQVIIVNSTIDPEYFSGLPEDLKEHAPGYFDDPEDKVSGRKRIVFTRNGLEEKEPVDVVQYTNDVQRLIQESLLKMILRKETQLTT